MTIYDKLDDLTRVRYPFADGAELRYSSGSGDVMLPNDVLIDLSISAYAGSTATCWLESFSLDADGYLLLGLSVCGSDVTVEVPPGGGADPIPFMASDLIHGVVLVDQAGAAAFTSLLAVDAVYLRASADVGVFEPRCILHSPGGAVLSIIGDAPGSSAVTGSIAVLDGINTRIRVDPALNRVIIYAEPGIGLKNCLQQLAVEGSDALLYFNGAKANKNGEATLRTDGRIKLRPNADGDELELVLAEDVTALLDCAPDYDESDQEP
jgi:hypothetical protein